MANPSKKWLSAKNKLPTFFMLPPAALAHPNMTKKKLQVLGILALFANSAGEVTDHSPCEDKIAEILKWFTKGKPHRSTVSEQISALAKDGWITIIKRDGVDLVNHYQLHQLDVDIKFTDRSSVEYLTKAEAKRAQVRKDYSIAHTVEAHIDSIPDPEEVVDFDALLDSTEVIRHLNQAVQQDHDESIDLEVVPVQLDVKADEKIQTQENSTIDKNATFFTGASAIKGALRRIAKLISSVPVSDLEMVFTFAAIAEDFPDLVVSYATLEEYLKKDILH